MADPNCSSDLADAGRNAGRNRALPPAGVRRSHATTRTLAWREGRDVSGCRVDRAMFEPGRAIIFAISSKRISPLARLHPAEGHCVVEASQGSFDQQPQSRSRYRLSLRTDSATEQELRIVRRRRVAEVEPRNRPDERKRERDQPQQGEQPQGQRVERRQGLRKAEPAFRHASSTGQGKLHPVSPHRR